MPRLEPRRTHGLHQSPTSVAPDPTAPKACEMQARLQRAATCCELEHCVGVQEEQSAGGTCRMQGDYARLVPSSEWLYTTSTV